MGVGSVVIGTAIHQLVGGMGQALMEPAWTLVHQKRRRSEPVEIPSAGEIIAAHQCGYLPFDKAVILCEYNGADYLGHNFSTKETRQLAWSAVAALQKEQPPTDMAWDAWIRGMIDDDQLTRLMKRNNANVTNWGAVQSLRYKRPETREVVDAHLRGMLDNDTYDLLFRQSGGSGAAWGQMYDAMRVQPGITELIVLRNRGLMDDDEFAKQINALGFDSAKWARQFDSLRELIPGPSDLVRFGVYHVFTPDIANGLLLYDERPDALDKWHDASGLHRPLGFPIVADGVQRDAKWADMYWGSHWRKLGADALATFLHRFRPDQIARYRALGFNVDVFDMPKMRTLLRMDDYPKWSRDYLAAVSFRPPDFRWVMRGINTGVYNAKQSTDSFLDHGYARDTAEDMTQILLKQKEQRDEAPLVAFGRKLASAAIKEIGHAYKIGAITRESAETAVKGFDLERAFLGPMFDGIDLQLSNELISSVITAIKKSYLAGASTQAEAIAQLLASGITQQRAVVYLTGWTALLSVNRKMATATQILGWLRGGLLSTEVAALRLRNLGWSNADTLLLLAESQAKVAKAEAAVMEREDRSRAKQAKDLEAQYAKLQAAQRSVQNRIRQLTPISKLQKWYASERITRQYFMGRLTAMGIPPDVRIQLEREAMDSRAKLIAKAEKDSQAAATKEAKVEAPKQTQGQPETPSTNQ